MFQGINYCSYVIGLVSHFLFVNANFFWPSRITLMVLIHSNSKLVLSYSAFYFYSDFDLFSASCFSPHRRKCKICC